MGTWLTAPGWLQCVCQTDLVTLERIDQIRVTVLRRKVNLPVNGDQPERYVQDRF